MRDPTSLLRSATRRAKSDVANKLISMFLHELSRTASKGWSTRVESEGYEEIVRRTFNNHCPYCGADLLTVVPVVEHLDGMNRFRVGLHVAGNVLVSCRKCNNEKRRDDSLPELILAPTGWESFLSHDGRCGAACKTCAYWRSVWPIEAERLSSLSNSLGRIREFREQFTEFAVLRNAISQALPSLVGKLYSDCQIFATQEIENLLELFNAQITREASQGKVDQAYR
jgi:hypothetical protein